jgi:hypothetical protein
MFYSTAAVTGISGLNLDSFSYNLEEKFKAMSD